MCVITIPCNNKNMHGIYFSVVLFHNVTVRYDWILVYSYYIMCALNLNSKNKRIVSYVVAFSYFIRKKEARV